MSVTAFLLSMSNLHDRRLQVRRLLLSLVLLSLASPLLAQTLSEARSVEATTLYMEPSREAPEQQQMPVGTEVRILGYRIARDLAEWWQVELVDSGASGFVTADAMETLSTTTATAPEAETPPAFGSSSLFAQILGVGGSETDRGDTVNGGQSVFAQLARSGEIEQGQARTRQQELEAELRRQEQLLLEQERQEQQRLAAEEDRLRREEEALWQQENDWYDDGWFDEPQANNIASNVIDRIQQGFQELNDLQITIHQDTMRNLELSRQNQENQRQQQEQQEWQWQQQRQNQQNQQEQQRQQLEQQRQQLAQQRQQREQELARQRAAIEAQRQQQNQQRVVTAGAVPASPATSPSFGGTAGQSRPLSGNPGRDAPDCIRIGHESVDFRDDAYHVIFSNACDIPVFVIWCGSSPYGLNCGENVADFYTSSANLRPGWQHRALVHDRINWGACEGTIGFGHLDFYTDHDNGDYTCLPTGDHARAQSTPQRVSPRSHQ